MGAAIPGAIPGRADFERVLRRHVLDAWFPRCIDQQYGGFLSDFDSSWNDLGPHDKFLEFQARQTLLAADACALYPGDAGLRRATEHGFRFLSEVLWDRESGGWFHRLDRAGHPKEADTKHAHGAAYAIEASAAVYAATGDPAALRHAQEGFQWLDQHARDPVHGGYWGFLTRGNAVIREPSQCPYPATVDTIGTLIGFKDANVHSDLVETFTNLYRVWPDLLVQERLAEITGLVADRMVVAETGAMHIFVTADWTPVPHLCRSGYQAQTAWRFLAARGLGMDDARLERLAGRLLDHALHSMADPAGGYLYAMPGAAPTELGGRSLLVRDKPWWVEAEMVKALVAVRGLFPDDAGYASRLSAQWDYLTSQLLDERRGGFYMRTLDLAPRWRRGFGGRLAPRHLRQKGDVWKDGSHEGRALIYCMSAPGVR